MANYGDRGNGLIFDARLPGLGDEAGGHGFTRSGAPGTSAGAAGGVSGASGTGLAARLTEYTSGGTWHFSGNQDIDAVLIGSKWAITNLTYSFPSDGTHYNTPYYDPDYVVHQIPLNTAQQAAAIYAFGLISAYSNLTFTEVSESDSVHGTIRLSQTSSSDEASAEGNFPGSDASDGDIWFGQTNQPFYLTPQIGNWGQATFMHEIGHTMGLKHGQDNYTSLDLTRGSYIDGPGPFYGTAALPSGHDGQAWSLMTYRSDPGNTIVFEGDEFNQPQTYMQDDIAALQYLYGANFTTNAADSVYTVSATTGEMFINGVSQGDPDGSKVFRTVWDGNGNDTYDFSNFSGDESIDLRAGGWSTFSVAQLANNRAYSGGTSYAPGNIANALMYQGDARSLIENAVGGSGSDHMLGNQVDNQLSGNGGDDWLDGGAGNDTLSGGTGNDTYFVDSADDVVVELVGEGSDTVVASASFTLSAEVENLTLAGYGNLAGTGNAGGNIILGNGDDNVLSGGDGSDTLIGNSGAVVVHDNDTLDGGAGADMMSGGLGDDSYYVDATGDVVTELNGQGNDNVFSSLAGYTLGQYVENLILLGDDNLAGTGNSLANGLTGNRGDNVLDGGTGADIMTGGLGDDTYVVDNSGDVVVENAGEGSDTVVTAASYILGANIDNLTLTGNLGRNGYGNGLDNVIVGNSGNNGLKGYDGNDSLDGGLGADTMGGGNGNDVYYVDNTGDVVAESSNQGTDTVFTALSAYILTANVENLTLSGSGDSHGTGNTLANVITGNDGNNILDGGKGADTLIGGVGNDTYVVDNTGDVVMENAGEGVDTLQTASSYILGQNIENLTLTGGLDRSGYGNGLDNVITGNSGHNVLKGYDGNDTLDGGLGADTLAGGNGNDAYYVDDGGDVVTESSNQGTDTVYSSLFAYTLGSNVENLILLGTDNLNGAGNSLANIITGTGGDNILNGGGGADTLTGGLGNDTYVIDNTGDVVVEHAGEGIDTIQTSSSYILGVNFENLTLTGALNRNGYGNTVDNVMIGNSGNNGLKGYAGNDMLDGGAGNDSLSGGIGADVFVFNDNSGADTVSDFSAAQNDVININAYTHGNGDPGLLHQVGADTVVDLGGGNIITVLNALVADLSGHIVW